MSGGRPVSRDNSRTRLDKTKWPRHSSRGKGSHTMFFREIGGSVFSVPIPTGRDVLPSYIRQVRRRFRLSKADGVTDDEFYSHA